MTIPPPDATPAPDVDDWSRRFLRLHLRRHPVDATFIGIQEHDHELPDVSPAGVDETVDGMRGLLTEDDGDVAPQTAVESPFQALDRKLIRGFLESRIWEYESGHVAANPSALVGDAVFGLMGPLLTRRSEVRQSLEARMRGLPTYFEGARAALEVSRDSSGPVRGSAVPAEWTRRAIRECRGGARFVEEGLDFVDGGAETAPIRAEAAAAFRSFAHFLESEVLPAGSDDVACGAEAFQLYLRKGHFVESADEIAAYARDELERTRAWLESEAIAHGGATPAEVMAGLAHHHPDADGYLRRYRETWEEMRAVALERELVTWPNFPIEYVERPLWARAAAPDLYFLFYRSPPAFHRPDVHRYMVAPLDSNEPEAFLRSNNDSVIKLNHVVHHGGIGHHVQNWHASRSPSLVGRIAAVDCASRIAMFCGGTMAEGWACYATDLMAEAGGLTDLERYAEHHGRVRMCARAIVDVELHHGRMSLDEAAAFYRREAAMSPGAAMGEAVKNSMFPGAALMYLVGTDAIHELRRDLMGVMGDRFVLRDFHDAFLSYGSIPVRLVADEMRRRARVGLPLGAHEAASGPPAWAQDDGTQP